MKTLHLYRHAKAAEGAVGGNDHARALAKRGIKSAKAMAEHFDATDFSVDHVYCSTARRTRETYDHVARTLGNTPMSFRDRLYLIDVGELMDFIHSLPDAIDSAMLIGHNPGFYIAALMMVKEASRGRGEELDALKEKFPTGALCSIAFDVKHWKSIKAGGGTLTAFIRPRDLGID